MLPGKEVRGETAATFKLNCQGPCPLQGPSSMGEAGSTAQWEKRDLLEPAANAGERPQFENPEQRPCTLVAQLHGRMQPLLLNSKSSRGTSDPHLYVKSSDVEGQPPNHIENTPSKTYLQTGGL